MQRTTRPLNITFSWFYAAFSFGNFKKTRNRLYTCLAAQKTFIATSRLTHKYI